MGNLTNPTFECSGRPRAGRRASLFARLAAVALTLAFTAACTKISTQAGHPTTGNPWTHHGILRMAGISEPDILNPLLGTQQIEVDLSMFWAGYLFLWNDKNQFVPDLATEVPSLRDGGISKDGLRITYHLRKGVRWQDGAPFTGDDVIFSWHAVMNPNNNVGNRIGYDLITAIDEPDPYTIVVHLKKRYAPFVATFFNMSSTVYSIQPKHLLEKYSDLNRVPYNLKPVGTGPFKVDKYEKGAVIKFVANPDYWRGPPKLKEIEYRIIPDENTILTQVRTHEIDMYWGSSAALYPNLQGIPGTRLYLTPFTAYAQLALNLRNPILAEKRVRQALAYATDTRALIAKVQHGVSIPGAGDQPAFLWAHNRNIKRYDYRPDEAGRLLDGAGWKLAADGYRYKDGKKLQLELTGVTGSATGNSAEALVQEQWRRVGVDAAIKNYVTPKFFASYAEGGIVQTGKFDVAFYGWINGVDPDDSTLWMCDQFPPAGQNTYHYCNPELDAAERVALTEYDQTKRKAAYDEIQAILAEDEPAIVVWFTRRLDIVNTDLKNYKPAHAVSTLWNSWQWEI